MNAISRLAVVAVLALAAPTRAHEFSSPPTEAQSRAAKQLLVSHIGSGARGCLSERQLYAAYHRYNEAAAWNPDDPVNWYVTRNTVGSVESMVNAGYRDVAWAWLEIGGTDFKAIGASCRAAKTPRVLAGCIDERVHEYVDQHPNVRPWGGGPCKMYAAIVFTVASYFPAVTREASLPASMYHVFNRLSIRDAEGRDHVFMIDAMTNLVIELSDDKGVCPDEGTLAPAGVDPAAAAAAAREAEQTARQKEASRRVSIVESAGPQP